MSKWEVTVIFPVEAETGREAKNMVLEDLALDEDLLDSVRIKVTQIIETPS